MTIVKKDKVWNVSDIGTIMRKGIKPQVISLLDELHTQGFLPNDLLAEPNVDNPPATLLSYTSLAAPFLCNVDERNAWLIVELLRRGERIMHLEPRTKMGNVKKIDVTQKPRLLGRYLSSQLPVNTLIDEAMCHLPFTKLIQLFDTPKRMDETLQSLSEVGVKRLALFLSKQYGEVAVSMLTESLETLGRNDSLIESVFSYIDNHKEKSAERNDSLPFALSVSEITVMAETSDERILDIFHRVGDNIDAFLSLFVPKKSVEQSLKDEQVLFCVRDALFSFFIAASNDSLKKAEVPIALHTLAALCKMPLPPYFFETTQWMQLTCDLAKQGDDNIIKQVFAVCCEVEDGGMFGAGKTRASFLLLLWFSLQPKSIDLGGMVQRLDKQCPGWQSQWRNVTFQHLPPPSAPQCITIGSLWAKEKVALLLENMSFGDALVWVQKNQEIRGLLMPALLESADSSEYSTVRKESLDLLLEYVEPIDILPHANTRIKKLLMEKTFN